MQKYQYRVERHSFPDPQAMEKYLNKVANDGWKLVDKDGFLFVWEKPIHKKPGPKRRISKK